MVTTVRGLAGKAEAFHTAHRNASSMNKTRCMPRTGVFSYINIALYFSILMHHECSGVACTASIPPQIGKLSKLTHLRLQRNELSGESALFEKGVATS